MLSFGNYRIAAMSPTERQPRAFAGFETGRNTNPEFDADGSLFFVATPDGIPNVYRRTGTDSPTRVTNVVSGVSGITPLTPAMSAASNASWLVFTVFEDDRYNIYVTDTSRPPPTGVLLTDTSNAALLPPDGTPTRRRRASPPTRPPRACCSRAITRSATIAPSSRSMRSANRRLVSAPISSARTPRAVFRFFFSDILGDHMLGATVQSTSRIEDTGGSVVYLNRTRRWNWGAVVEHLPYSTGAFAQGVTTIDGEPTIVQQTYRVTQLNSGVNAIVHYPFSRIQRIEFSAGVRRIGFDAELETQFFSTTGQVLGEETEDLPRPGALGLAEATAALVYDSSVFGATSPLLGRSYRFGLLADGRLAVVCRRARRLPPLLHAQATVHLRGARPALRPLRR